MKTVQRTTSSTSVITLSLFLHSAPRSQYRRLSAQSWKVSCRGITMFVLQLQNLLKRKQRYLFLLLLCKAAFKTFYGERLKYLKNKHTTKLQMTKEEISAVSCIADSLSQPHSAKFAITMIFFFFPAENEARIVSLWQQETLKTLLP